MMIKIRHFLDETNFNHYEFSEETVFFKILVWKLFKFKHVNTFPIRKKIQNSYSKKVFSSSRVDTNKIVIFMLQLQFHLGI